MSEGIIIALITTGLPILGGLLTLLGQYFINKGKKNQKKKEELLLINHPFFRRMNELRNHIMISFTLQNKGKELIFKQILARKISIWKDEMFTLSKIVDEKDIENDLEFMNMHLDAFQSALTKYTNFYLSDEFTSDEKECLNKVMTKFNKWHEHRILYMQSFIRDVCANPFYTDYKTKHSAILDGYLGAFADTINDANRTLNELNGDLKGLKYKNQVL